jgi:hypothetical protein
MNAGCGTESPLPLPSIRYARSAAILASVSRQKDGAHETHEGTRNEYREVFENIGLRLADLQKPFCWPAKITVPFDQLDSEASVCFACRCADKYRIASTQQRCSSRMRLDLIEVFTFSAPPRTPRLISRDTDIPVCATGAGPPAGMPVTPETCPKRSAALPLTKVRGQTPGATAVAQRCRRTPR